MHGFRGALLWCVVVCGFAQRADAQVRTGDLRLSLDTELLSYGAGTIESEYGGPFGENAELDIDGFQIGNAAAPGLLGIGYAVTSQVVLGLRFGVGFQRQEYDGLQTYKVTTLSLLPSLTYVLSGERVKPFFEVGPLFAVNRYKQELPPLLRAGDDEVTMKSMAGGFVLAGGVLLFAGENVSIDLAAFFEARFGDAAIVQPVSSEDTSARWFRGGLRLGLSLWM